MDLLQDQKILLCVCGGVAAYKAAALVRRLADAGAVVQVAMTANAERFVTATTFQALSGRPVRTSLWDAAAEAAMGHIELARWPDRIVIAPASANTIARLAHGLADDLVSTLCLATDAPLALAPAMNRLMWAHPATQANVETLRARGALLLGPDSGGQACGEVGEGRMMEPDAIVAALARSSARPWAIRARVLAVAGATTIRSGQRASSMWPIAASAASSQSELRTGCPESAWKVAAPTKRNASAVIATRTCASCWRRRRTSSAAL